MKNNYSEKEITMYVKTKFPGYKVKKIRDTSSVYLFMCEALDRNIIPSKIAVAINKTNLKIGTSILGYEEAISEALR